jgi:hypothetical protein
LPPNSGPIAQQLPNLMHLESTSCVARYRGINESATLTRMIAIAAWIVQAEAHPAL